MGIVQRITTSTRGLLTRRIIGNVHYIECKGNQKNWINCIIFEKLLTLTLTGTLTLGRAGGERTLTGTGTGTRTFLRPTEQASKLERTLTLTLTLTLTGTVIFEGSTVNNINNKWRGIEEGERGCFGVVYLS